MTTLKIESLVATTNHNVIGTVSANMFGAIAVNNFGWHYFNDHIDNLGLTNIRFPGGTVSETGWVVDGRIRMSGGEISLNTLDGNRANFAFDLTHPELISPLALRYDDTHFLHRDDVGTFSQALAEAIENEGSLDLIIPVQRYFRNANFSDPATRSEAIDAAVSDITVFLTRLKNGEYNGGEYPETITFEIGNEAYSNPIEYAVIAKAMMDAIDEQLAGSEIAYDVAFQIGRGEFEFSNLLRDGYFDKFFDGTNELIDGLEDIGFFPSSSMPFEERQTAIDEMMIAILGDSIGSIDAIRQHILRFNADLLDNPNAPLIKRSEVVDHWMEAFEGAGVDPETVDYYISAYTTDSSNGQSMPYELSAAANTLELFGHMMENGVDKAAIWGVVGAFRYKDSILPTTVSDRLSKFDAPQAAIVKLLSQNVVNSDFIGSAGSDPDGYRSFTYEGEGEYHIFFYVEDVGDGDVTIDVDLGLLGDLQTVQVVNMDIENGAMNGASRLSERQVDVADGMVQIMFDQNFEIAMLTLEKDLSPDYQTMAMIERMFETQLRSDRAPETTYGVELADDISGSASIDVIFGMGGDDSIDGGAGRTGFFNGDVPTSNFDAVGANNGDFLFGGAGNDLLKGHAGNDAISGGEGDDELWGGSGFDTFVFNAGRDEIRDFQSGVDKILVDAHLFAANEDLGSWLEQNIVVNESSAVIDFGRGNELEIYGLSNVADVIDSIEIGALDPLYM